MSKNIGGHDTPSYSLPTGVEASSGPECGIGPEDGHPQEGKRPSKLGWLALVLFLAVSACITWYARNHTNLFVGNLLYNEGWFSVLGYTHFLGDEVINKENAPFVEMVTLFNGYREPEIVCYVYRAYPAFLAALLSPAVGALGGLQLVNWLAWALCAWSAWRLSKKLFADDLAALLAVVFVLGGIGMIAHLPDLSAHLSAHAVYYLGVYLLYSSGILFERQPWRTHLMLGTYFAMASLVYNTGVMLIGVYVLSALWNNRWLHVAGAAALGLAGPWPWRGILWLLDVPLPGEGFERDALRNSLRGWSELLGQPLPEIAVRIGQLLSEFALIDSPIVFVVGVLSCLLLPRDRATRWFGVLVLGVPILAMMVYAQDPTVLARGYPIFGITIWVNCWFGRLLALGLRGRPAVRVAAVLGLLLAVSSHFAWSTAHWRGNFGPAGTYTAGFRNAEFRTILWPTVVSMTGLEETPILEGGTASLRAAGAHVTDAEVPVAPDLVPWHRAALSRALFFGYLTLFGILAVNTLRRRLLVVAGMACLAVASLGLTQLTSRTIPKIVNPDVTILLPAGAKLSYRAELSPSFLDTLRQASEPQDQLFFFFCLSTELDRMVTPEYYNGPTVDVSVAAGSVPVPVEHGSMGLCAALDREAALAALTQAGSLTVEVANTRLGRPVYVVGWQRPDLPRRHLDLTPGGPDDDNPSADCLPAIEIRLVRPDGTVKVAGF